MRHRRAFVLLPLVVVLALSAATFGVIYGLNAPPKPTGNAAYNRGGKWGMTFGFPVVALYFAWQAGRWAEQHGTGSANAVFGGILAMMNLALGINAYRVTIGKSSAPAPQVARGPGPPGFQQSPQGQSSTSNGAPSGVGSTGGSVAPTPGPNARPSTPSRAEPGPAAQPALVVPTPSPADIERGQAEARAAPVVEAFRTRLAAEVVAAASAAEGFSGDVARAPAHDKRVLKERVANAGALRNALTRVESRLKSASDDVEKELIAGGVESFEARQRAVRFSMDLDASSRQFAAGRLIDLCDRVETECEVLDKEFASWTLVKGEITVKDIKKRHELTTQRFFIEAETKDIGRTLGSMRDGL